MHRLPYEVDRLPYEVVAHSLGVLALSVAGSYIIPFGSG